MGDDQADLVQQRSPGQQPRRIVALQVPGGRHLLQQLQGRALDLAGVGTVHSVTLRRGFHRAAAHVAVGEAAEQVVDHAFAQRALGSLHLLQTEAVEHPGQHRDAAGEDRTSILAQAGEIEAVDAAGAHRQVQRLVQRFAGDQLVGPALAHHHAPGAAHRAAGAHCHVPAGSAVAALDEFQLDPRRQPRLAHARPRHLAVSEKTLGMGDAAERHALHQLGLAQAADDQLGAAAADVHHQPARPRLAHAVGHAAVDQARFLHAGNDLDLVAQRALGRGDESGALLHLAQGIGADHTHPLRRDAVQALAEARQAVQRACLRLRREPVLGVQTGAQADRVAQTVDYLQLAAALTRHHHVEAVGAKVHRRHLAAGFAPGACAGGTPQARHDAVFQAASGWLTGVRRLGPGNDSRGMTKAMDGLARTITEARCCAGDTLAQRRTGRKAPPLRAFAGLPIDWKPRFHEHIATSRPGRAALPLETPR